MTTCPTCSDEPTQGAFHDVSCGSGPILSTARQQSDPFVGQTVAGVYLVRSKIGSGGMGDVYLAVHKNLEQPVALKIVKRSLLATQPALHERFQREARAASALRHPNVVSVTDFGRTENGTLFMVMEFITGRNLARLIADDGPLLERRVVGLGAQILAALEEAHTHEVLHRDLRPENVMVEARHGTPDSVKVLDFGIAKLLAAGSSPPTFTEAGLVYGTPGYMSPEQLRGEEVDRRSDLFSVGVVLYEMLTQRLPIDAPTPMELLQKILSGLVPPPSRRRACPISPRLEALIMRALSASREGRPDSAEAMRAQLLDAIRATPPGVTMCTDGFPPEALAVMDALPTPSRETLARSPAIRPAAPPPQTPLPQGSIRKPGVANGTSFTPPLAGVAALSGPGHAWEPALLRRIEEKVSPFLGPCASHLVGFFCRRAATAEELCGKLAAFIPAGPEQGRFLAWSRSGIEALGMDESRHPRGRTPPPSDRTAPFPGPATASPDWLTPSTARTTAFKARATPSPAPPKTSAGWDPEVLEWARRNLAIHLGPVAAVLVRRAASRARTLRELYDLLALEIPSEDERQTFSRHALLARHSWTMTR